jgi:serine/threonine protein kinase
MKCSLDIYHYILQSLDKSNIKFTFNDISIVNDNIEVFYKDNTEFSDQEIVDLKRGALRELGIPFIHTDTLTKIGSGSDGVIWRINNSAILKRYNQSDDLFINSLLREYAILKLLERDVGYYFEKDILQGIFMKYYKIGNLEVAWSHNEHVSKWIQQLSEQLIRLHKQNIAHGDVSGTNIVFDSEYNLFLIDFSRSGYGYFCGHRHYLPPDRQNNPDLLNSIKLDMYAFAVLIVEMLTRNACKDHSKLDRISEYTDDQNIINYIPHLLNDSKLKLFTIED